MDYKSWSINIVEKLIIEGLSPEIVTKVFDEAAEGIRVEYEKGDQNSAGACFVKALVKYDLDLEIASERGNGRSQSDLAAAYEISIQEARSHWMRGFAKKVAILAWFRGDDVNPTPSFKF